MDFDSSNYYIKICSGCVHACTYCAIKKAKGGIKSETPDSIIEQLRIGIEQGVTRFNLLADDCGSYGADIGTDIAELLTLIRSYTDLDITVDISSMHPGRLVDLYPKISSSVVKMLGLIVLHIQSISSDTLKIMNRNYAINEVIRIVRDIKRINPKTYITTIIIFGFPTETTDDIIDSFPIADIFDLVTYFAYSERGNLAHLPSVGKEDLYDRIRLIKNEQLKRSNITIFTFDA
jgi:tRNA A37 methylthiotransferase MiaB